MMPDVLNMINDDHLSPESDAPSGPISNRTSNQSGNGLNNRRLPMSREDHELFALNMRNFSSCEYKREIDYYNKLKNFILYSRSRLIGMYLTLASRAKIESLKIQRKKKVQSLSQINQSLEDGWMASKYGQEPSSPRNRFQELGAEAFHEKANAGNTEWMILRDNW